MKSQATRLFRFMPLMMTLVFIPTTLGVVILPDDQVVRYRIHATPSDPTSDVVFTAILYLDAVDSVDDTVAWDVTAMEFSQPGSGNACPTWWDDANPTVHTTGGLWWVDHADGEDPQIDEFVEPPLIDGTADAVDTSNPDLDHSIEGGPYTPPPGGAPYSITASLTYSFTLVGQSEPEEEGDDDPGDVDDNDNPPKCRCDYDVNMDGKVNGKDIQPAIALFVSGGFSWSQDMSLFVYSLLEDPAPPHPGFADCNNNGVKDAIDIAGPTSNDCNANFIPDSCDIAGPTSTDVNTNSVPDDCEADCNNNDVLDGVDIAGSTSTDVNNNAIPDECEPDCNTNDIPDAWDISGTTSNDCNTNGVPDECDGDCNTNGKPDDCDIAQGTSRDCNANERPDECDLASSLAHSYDCNTNNVPDECDIAGTTSDDCNTNYIPDSCDIQTGVCQDANSNGIPDVCQPGIVGGGRAGKVQGDSDKVEPDGSQGSAFLMGGTEADLERAWERFWRWHFAQIWGPAAGTSGAEQFQAAIDKLRDLGLPLRGPNAPPSVDGLPE